MPLRPFLDALLDGGRVRVARPPEAPMVERAGLEEVLVAWDRLARQEAPGTAPTLSVDVAAWAATVLYRGCQFLVYREFGAAIVEQALRAPCPGPRTPAAAWSADLTLRWLPDLVSLSRGIAEGDPLVVELLRLAREWPLSSVGVRGAGPVDSSWFAGDPCLRQLYTDRILARRDVSRVDSPAVRDAVRSSLGLWSELCPEVSAACAAAVGSEGSA